MKKIEITLSIFFVFIVLLPLIGMVSKPNQVNPSDSDIWNIKTIVNTLSNAKYNYSENYAFRESLISVNGNIKTKLFHNSSSNKVLLGKEGWLYLASEKTLDNHRNIYHFSNEEIQLWGNILKKRRDFSQKMCANYYFTVSPDKGSIYSEFLPINFEPVSDLSRKDELEQILYTQGINYIDLSESLIEHKDSFPLYYKTDTHWNELGAYYGYLKIIERLQKDYPELHLRMSNPQIVTKQTHGGDLARMMGLADSMGDVLYHVGYDRNATLQNGDEIELEMIDVQHAGRIDTTCESGEINKAVIFHDSFGVALIPLLAEHFQEAVFILSNDFDSDFVAEFKPDVVIQQIVERRLLNWLPDINEIK